MVNKNIIGFIVISIIFLLVISIIIVYNTGNNDEAVPIIIPENNFYYENPLEGIPYVGQETSIFCASASITALLQYLDIDVTLSEILFLPISSIFQQYSHSRGRSPSNILFL